jgi:hypothetical protein
LEHAGHRDQGVLTGGMTEAVVDDLQLVDVHEQKREGLVKARRVLHRAALLIHEGPRVREAGQRVVLREIAVEVPPGAKAVRTLADEPPGESEDEGA